MPRRLPAEWEPLSGVLMAWPHAGTDWLDHVVEAQYCVAQIGAAISTRTQLLLIAPDPDEARVALLGAGADVTRLTIRRQPVGDTWTRDYGPISVYDDDGPLLLDFCFNGWGLKYPAATDNMATRRLHAAGAFGATALQTCGLVLEGGSIESDGAGTVLTTAGCLAEANRNPHLDRPGIVAELRRLLGATRILWLEHGRLDGDDTDGHIDTLARFCPADTICHVSCDDPDDPHYSELAAMTAELAALRCADGRPFRLVPLPWPQAIYDADGRRLPATYANFLICGDAVLVPRYRDPADEAACAAIATCFPDRDIVTIDCRVLLEQHGSLHCMTMQLPAGVLP